jgi:hypothetical protein
VWEGRWDDVGRNGDTTSYLARGIRAPRWRNSCSRGGPRDGHVLSRAAKVVIVYALASARLSVNRGSLAEKVLVDCQSVGSVSRVGCGPYDVGSGAECRVGGRANVVAFNNVSSAIMANHLW